MSQCRLLLGLMSIFILSAHLSLSRAASAPTNFTVLGVWYYSLGLSVNQVNSYESTTSGQCTTAVNPAFVPLNYSITIDASYNFATIAAFCTTADCDPSGCNTTGVVANGQYLQLQVTPTAARPVGTNPTIPFFLVPFWNIPSAQGAVPWIARLNTDPMNLCLASGEQVDSTPAGNSGACIFDTDASDGTRTYAWMQVNISGSTATVSTQCNGNCTMCKVGPSQPVSNKGCAVLNSGNYVVEFPATEFVTPPDPPIPPPPPGPPAPPPPMVAGAATSYFFYLYNQSPGFPNICDGSMVNTNAVNVAANQCVAVPNGSGGNSYAKVTIYDGIHGYVLAGCTDSACSTGCQYNGSYSNAKCANLGTSSMNFVAAWNGLPPSDPTTQVGIGLTLSDDWKACSSKNNANVFFQSGQCLFVPELAASKLVTRVTGADGAFVMAQMIVDTLTGAHKVNISLICSGNCALCSGGTAAGGVQSATCGPLYSASSNYVDALNGFYIEATFPATSAPSGSTGGTTTSSTGSPGSTSNGAREEPASPFFTVITFAAALSAALVIW